MKLNTPYAGCPKRQTGQALGGFTLPKLRWSGANGQRAQGIVELALTLPALLMLVMGIIDFGLALRSYVVVTNASREGARYAIVCPATDDLIRAKVVDSAGSIVKQNSDVSVTWQNQGTSRCTSGQPVEVRTFSDYTYVTPILKAFLPNPLRVTSKTTMRVE